MTDTDRQTLPSEQIANVEDGVAPPWRCQEYVKNDQYAVQRVLEVVRGEDGKFYLLLEYLGYRYLEIRLDSCLVDKNSELKRAYREHANTRSSLSMLYCAGAILDAMWHGRSLQELGMEIKLVHQDARLYLISCRPSPLALDERWLNEIPIGKAVGCFVSRLGEPPWVLQYSQLASCQSGSITFPFLSQAY